MSTYPVVVLGASPNRERYSNMAVRDLVRYGHPVIPVHPTATEIEGLAAKRSLSEIAGPVDTVSVYLHPDRSIREADAIIALSPRRVILNPGAESAALSSRLSAVGIDVVLGCTLVMLRTGTFSTP